MSLSSHGLPWVCTIIACPEHGAKTASVDEFLEVRFKCGCAPDVLAKNANEVQTSSAFPITDSEAEFYNQTSRIELEDIRASEGFAALTKYTAGGQYHDIDSAFEAPAQRVAWDWVMAAPSRELFAQLGGKGIHAIKALLAGWARAVVVSPVLGELEVAQALALEFGVADRLATIAAIGEETHLASESVDGVYLGGTLHHMETGSSASEIARVLKHGGRIAAIDPWAVPVLHRVGTAILGKREVGVNCRPIDRDRLDQWHHGAPDLSIQLSWHSPLFRYIMLGLVGVGFPISHGNAVPLLLAEERLARPMRSLLGRGVGSVICIRAQKSHLDEVENETTGCEPRSILHVVNDESGEYGGPGVVAAELVYNANRSGREWKLAAQSGQGRAPSATIARLGRSEWLRLQSTSVLGRSEPFARVPTPKGAMALWRAIRSTEAVWLHQSREPFMVLAAAFSHALGKEIFLQPHGMLAPDSRTITKVIDAVLRHLLRDTSVVWALTASDREFLPKVKAKDVRNGVPAGLGPGRAPFGLLILYAGRLAPRKQVPALVASMDYFGETTKPQLTIIGPNHGDADSIRRAVEAAACNEITLIAQAIPQEQVWELLRAASVFVLPSRDEPYPLALLEAIAHEVPVVCLEDCGLAPLIVDNQLGVVVPSADPALLAAAIVAASRLRETPAFQAACREVVDSNSWASVLAQEIFSHWRR